MPVDSRFTFVLIAIRTSLWNGGKFMMANLGKSFCDSLESLEGSLSPCQ
jgi:hypothetical protein